MPDAFSSLVETFKNVAVSKAYGPAVQVAGEELIPVALVSFGFGGGSDPEAGDGNGAAGGGGASSSRLACIAEATAGTWFSGPTRSRSWPGWSRWCMPGFRPRTASVGAALGPAAERGHIDTETPVAGEEEAAPTVEVPPDGVSPHTEVSRGSVPGLAAPARVHLASSESPAGREALRVRTRRPDPTTEGGRRWCLRWSASPPTDHPWF